MSVSEYLGETPVMHEKTKDELAMEFISLYGWIDGAHHKKWLVDQVARILLGTPVIVKEAKWASGHSELRHSTGEPSEAYLNWIGDDIHDDEVVGIAP